MRLLDVGHELLFALLTKDRHVPKPWERSPGAPPGEGGVRQNVERKAWVCSGWSAILSVACTCGRSLRGLPVGQGAVLRHHVAGRLVPASLAGEHRSRPWCPRIAVAADTLWLAVLATAACAAWWLDMHKEAARGQPVLSTSCIQSFVSGVHDTGR